MTQCAFGVDVAAMSLYQLLGDGEPQPSATGGPDPVRGIYPVIATITAEGFERLADEDVASRTSTLISRLGGAS